jgi:hypothetical protein
MEQAELDRLKAMAGEARALARSDHVMIRVAGERIAVIIADLLYEIDPGLDAVTPLLPEYRR